MTKAEKETLLKKGAEHFVNSEWADVIIALAQE